MVPFSKVTADGRKLFLTSADGALVLWDIDEKFCELARYELPPADRLILSDDGRWLAACGANETVIYAVPLLKQ